MKKISVIVPVYKVEPYLERCVHSIMEQTHRNLEIILVDDGSPDNCGIICDTLAKQDHRIKVIHQQNGGISAARNAGLDCATGDYIGFVDSDDWIDPDMYAVLYRLCEEYGTDIAECGYREIQTDRSEERSTNTEQIHILSPTQAIEALCDNTICTPIVWNKLYKRHVVETLRFPAGYIHEDEFFTPCAYLNANKVLVLDKSFVNYERRNVSSITANFSLKNLDVCEAFRLRMHQIERYPELNEISSKIATSYCWNVFDKTEKCISANIYGEKLIECFKYAVEELPLIRSLQAEPWYVEHLEVLLTLKESFEKEIAEGTTPVKKLLLSYEKRWTSELLRLRSHRIDDHFVWLRKLQEDYDKLVDWAKQLEEKNIELEVWARQLEEKNIELVDWAKQLEEARDYYAEQGHHKDHKLQELIESITL